MPAPGQFHIMSSVNENKILDFEAFCVKDDGITFNAYLDEHLMCHNHKSTDQELGYGIRLNTLPLSNKAHTVN